MSYDILDAIRDEIAFCKDAEKLCKSMEGMGFVQVAYREQARSLNRILHRLEKGLDFSIDFKNKKIINTETNRKSNEILEKENIALQKAGENYRLIKELVSDEKKENEE